VLKKIALALALLALTLAAPQSLAAQRYVVVVNPRNPVVRLSHLQISKIFLGKLQAWDFNGTLQPVSPVDLRIDSPLRAVFSQNVLRKSVSETASYWRQELYAGRNVPPPEQSESDALETVRTVIGAIAYVSDKADLKGVKVVTVQ
jgi:ABC-type phosphate transport system substrate-binding protein